MGSGLRTTIQRSGGMFTGAGCRVRKIKAIRMIGLSTGPNVLVNSFVESDPFGSTEHSELGNSVVLGLDDLKTNMEAGKKVRTRGRKKKQKKPIVNKGTSRKNTITKNPKEKFFFLLCVP